jgi:hypothetical protein
MPPAKKSSPSKAPKKAATKSAPTHPTWTDMIKVLTTSTNLLYTTLACHWRVSVFHRALRHRRLDIIPKKGQMLHRSLPCRRCLYPVSFPHAVSVPSAPVVLSSLFFSCEISVWRKADCSYRSVFPVIPRTRALAFLALKSRSPFLFYVVALSV